MTKRVAFVLLREGASDDGLLAHLSTLLVRAGADEAFGTSRPYTGTTQEKLASFAAEQVEVDVVFVHRDSDDRDHSPRYDEIQAAAASSAPPPHLVPVVPVQETEAWLLTDETAIRVAVGNPRGRMSLDLPSVSAIEKTASPKEILQMACLVASGTTGRRRQEERRKFNLRRRMLLERLDPAGEVQRLDSWKRVVNDLASTMTVL